MICRVQRPPRHRRPLGTATYYVYVVAWWIACVFGVLGPIQIEYKVLILTVLLVLTPNRDEWWDRQ